MAKFEILAGPSNAGLDERRYVIYVTRQEDRVVREFKDLNRTSLFEKLGMMRFPEEDKLRILYGQRETCHFRNVELNDNIAAQLGFPEL